VGRAWGATGVLEHTRPVGESPPLQPLQPRAVSALATGRAKSSYCGLDQNISPLARAVTDEPARSQ
jgi:hypothetical protein